MDSCISPSQPLPLPFPPPKKRRRCCHATPQNKRRRCGHASCKVVGITLSKEQKALAEEKVQAKGLGHLIHFELVDYRCVCRCWMEGWRDGSKSA